MASEEQELVYFVTQSRGVKFYSLADGSVEVRSELKFDRS